MSFGKLVGSLTTWETVSTLSSVDSGNGAEAKLTLDIIRLDGWGAIRE